MDKKMLPYYSEINELIEEIEKEKKIKIIFVSDCGSRLEKKKNFFYKIQKNLWME